MHSFFSIFCNAFGDIRFHRRPVENNVFFFESHHEVIKTYLHQTAICQFRSSTYVRIYVLYIYVYIYRRQIVLKSEKISSTIQESERGGGE